MDKKKAIKDLFGYIGVGILALGIIWSIDFIHFDGHPPYWSLISLGIVSVGIIYFLIVTYRKDH